MIGASDALPTSAVNEILQRLDRLDGAWIAPSLVPTSLAEHSSRLTAASAVRDALKTFAARASCQGWIETPQALALVGGHGSLVDIPGVPLHAELACGPESLQLRWCDGVWLLTNQREGPAADAEPCFATAVQRLACVPEVACWHYRVFLRAGPDGTLSPFTSRLTEADWRETPAGQNTRPDSQ